MSISIRVRPASFAADIHITGIFIHIAGIRIHIRPESLFTSLRNPYSHRPEYASPCLTRPFHGVGSRAETLSGKVTDRSGTVIALAQVTLYSEGRQFNRWTQPDGSFLFEG